MAAHADLDRAISEFDARHVETVAWSRASRRITGSGAYHAAALGYGVSLVPCSAVLFLSVYAPSFGSIVMGCVAGIVVVAPPTGLYLLIRRRRIIEREILLGQRCGACEYDLRGLGRDAACPECGAERAAGRGVSRD